MPAPQLARRIYGGVQMRANSTALNTAMSGAVSSIDLVQPNRKTWQRRRGEYVLRPMLDDR
jgi:hypothetical protein